MYNLFEGRTQVNIFNHWWGSSDGTTPEVDSRERSEYAYCERCGADMKLIVLPHRVVIKCGGEVMCEYKAWYTIDE